MGKFTEWGQITLPKSEFVVGHQSEADGRSRRTRETRVSERGGAGLLAKHAGVSPSLGYMIEESVSPKPYIWYVYHANQFEWVQLGYFKRRNKKC